MKYRIFITLIAFIAIFFATAPALAAEEPKHPWGSAEERRARMSVKAATAFYEPQFDLSEIPEYSPEQTVSGTLRVWGNNYIGDSPLASWWAEEFKKHHPDIVFDFNLPSAAIAIPSLYFGLADISVNHEPVFYDYLGHLRILGFEPTGISAFTGSYDIRGWQNTIAIVVNEKNPITKISMDELDGVFGSQRAGGWLGTTWHPEFARGPEKDIRTWGALGLEGGWADKKINVYGYSLRYATALEFSNKVLKSSDKWNGDLLAYGNWRRPDGTVYGQARHMMDLLLEDPAGIAYLRYDREFPEGLKVLDLAEASAGPYIKYTIENLQDRSYPLWGDQSFWVSRKPGTPMEPKVKEFLRYILSREGQAAVQRDGKYLPLTAEIVARELKKLD